MPPRRIRPTLALLAATIIGILLAPSFPLSPFVLGGIAITLFSVGLLCYRKSAPAAVFIWIVALTFLSMMRTQQVLIPARDDISSVDRSSLFWVRGSIVSDVDLRERKKVVFTLAVSHLSDGHVVRLAHGSVQVSGNASALTEMPETGDIFWLRGRLEAPPTATNPGAFDYRAFLANRGVFCWMRVRAEDTRFVQHQTTPLRWLVKNLREAIHRGNAALTPRFAGLMNGLVLSDRGGIPVETDEAFLRAGAVHLLSVSGAHMAALALFLTVIFDAIFAPRFVSALFIICLLWLFALASGASAAALRSALMSSIFLAAPLVRRTPDLTNSLAFAALVLLLCAPGDLYDVGFQFSFASLGVFCLYGAPLVRILLRRSPEDTALFRWTRPLLISLVAGIIFAMGSEPLSAYYFNRLSPISPISNLVVIPLAEILTIAGLASPALIQLPSLVLLFFSSVVTIGIQLFLFLIHAFAALPFASFSVVSPPLVAVIGYYLLLILFSPYLRRYAQQKILFNPDNSPSNLPDSPDRMLTQ